MWTFIDPKGPVPFGKSHESIGSSKSNECVLEGQVLTETILAIVCCALLKTLCI